MTYNEETRELTITLPDGDWYDRNRMVQVLQEVEKAHDKSEFFFEINDIGIRRLTYPQILWIAKKLEMTVNQAFVMSPVEQLKDPEYIKNYTKVIGKVARKLEDEERKRDLYGDNYDPDEDDDP